jgi:tetratricopeptide (TPR) repeat protein
VVTQTNQGAGAPNAALSYKEECVPITSTRSEVAGDIVHAMQVHLTPKEQARLARSQRTNSEAYDLYLRALVHVGLENRQDNQAAVELLEQAVARDPKFAPAYAALGREYRTKALIVDPNLGLHSASSGEQKLQPGKEDRKECFHDKQQLY